MRQSLIPWDAGTIIGATGNTLSTKGKLILPLTIGNVTKQCILAVVENFGYDLLLGMNVLLNSVINLQKYFFRLQHGLNVPLSRYADTNTPSFSVKPSNNLIIPARHVKFCRVHVSGRFDIVSREGKCLIFNGDIKGRTRVYACTSLATQNDNGEIVIGIINPTTEPITLKPNKQLGTLELGDVVDQGTSTNSDIPEYTPQQFSVKTSRLS